MAYLHEKNDPVNIVVKAIGDRLLVSEGNAIIKDVMENKYSKK